MRSLTPAELADRVKRGGQPAYRAEQVFRWLHGQGVDTLEAMKNVPPELREALAADGAWTPLALNVVQEAADGTRKLRFRTADGRAIESVLIPDEDEERDKLTLCVSSQVGCALDCGFCATATLGFGRNLTAGEIVEQVYRATRARRPAPHQPGLHGDGRAAAQLRQRRARARAAAAPVGRRTSRRGGSRSRRSGLVPGIEKLGQLMPAPNLAISLNATTDEVRDRIMPVNRRWPIAALLDAARRFPLAHGRRVTFEYVLLAGVNDSDADADRLPRLLRGIPSKVNLIPWNPFPGPPFERPSAERIRTFQERLRGAAWPSTSARRAATTSTPPAGQLAARRSDDPVTCPRALNARFGPKLRPDGRRRDRQTS